MRKGYYCPLLFWMWWSVFSWQWIWYSETQGKLIKKQPEFNSFSLGMLTLETQLPCCKEAQSKWRDDTQSCQLCVPADSQHQTLNTSKQVFNWFQAPIFKYSSWGPGCHSFETICPHSNLSEFQPQGICEHNEWLILQWHILEWFDLKSLVKGTIKQS